MRSLFATVAIFALLAPPAALAQAKAQSAAQEGKPVSAQARSEDEAANLMVRHIYVTQPVSIMLPSAVMTRLKSLGYSNLRDFDIERGHYEVEATNPAGRDVELEIDPISGAILDIDDNWF